MACVFMEMLRIRKLKENMQMADTSKNTLVAKPIRQSEIESRTKAKPSGTRLSKRDTSHPDMGKPINELMGKKSKI